MGEPAVLDLTPDQLLTTTRSVRQRLDFDRPVERDVVEDCVRIATQAPSGSNSQSWHWVFVTDPDRKEAIADHYREGFVAAYGPDVVPEMTDLEKKMWRSAFHLADNFHRVPVMMIPCQWKRLDGAPHARQAAYWGSILPAVWSFMLALRARGLGSAWTTLHLGREKEVAEILGIPYERCAQAGLFPVAYTMGTEFKAGPRRPVDRIIHWNQW